MKRAARLGVADLGFIMRKMSPLKGRGVSGSELTDLLGQLWYNHVAAAAASRMIDCYEQVVRENG